MSGDSQVTCLGEVKQVLLLPHLDHTHSHVLLYMNQDLEVKGQLWRLRNIVCSMVPIPPQVHTLPSSPEVTRHISTLTQALFLYSADVDSGLLTGYHLGRNNDQVDP